MPRPVTLFTGQWADLPLATLCQKIKAWGYSGPEIACWGDHMEPKRGATDPKYVEAKKALLAEHKLQCFALGAHLAGQCVGDLWDPRLDAFTPGDCKGSPEKTRAWPSRR
jgi:sugar phosphate isomerase/epimerase